MKKAHIEIEELEVYKLARELSKFVWEIFLTLDWRTKKIIGEQFIQSID